MSDVSEDVEPFGKVVISLFPKFLKKLKWDITIGNNSIRYSQTPVQHQAIFSQRIMNEKISSCEEKMPPKGIWLQNDVCHLNFLLKIYNGFDMIYKCLSTNYIAKSTAMDFVKTPIFSIFINPEKSKDVSFSCTQNTINNVTTRKKPKSVET